jgi:hypothetical protein
MRLLESWVGEMFRLNNGSFLSVSLGGIESELGEFLDKVSENYAKPVSNSGKVTKVLEMRTTGAWVQDSFTESYCDMSKSSDEILRQAYEATNTFIEPKITFEKFCKSHRVI